MNRILRSGGVSAFALLMALALPAPAFAQVPQLPGSINANAPFTPVQTAYAEDFELDDGGWTASELPPPEARPAPVNSDWEWGEPTSGPGEAFSGTNVWALNLDGFYRVPQCAAIMSPPIDLGGATSASVAFQHWVHMDSGTTIAFHAGLLMVTADGGETLTTVTPQGGYSSPGIGTSARACLDQSPSGQPGFSGGPSAAYEPVTVDLTAFAGQEIQFLFAFGTDGIGTAFNGWYVDEFAVTIDGVTTVEDFETSDGGFTVTSTALPGQPQRGWSRGQPTAGPEHVGTVWATNPDGDHGHGECHWVESPPFQVGAVPEGTGETLSRYPVTTAMLSWLQFFRTSPLIGQGVIQVGDADGSYTNVTPVGGYDRAVHSELAECLGADANVYAGTRDPEGGSMQVAQADLTRWLGEEITVRFVFASRGSGTTNVGWYIDDVKVELGAGAGARVGIPAVPGSPDAPFTRLATLYAEDFEGSDGGWTESGTGEWDWGTPASPPNPLPGSLNVWGTNTRGSHSTSACSWVTSPPISLPGAGAAGPVELAQMEFDLFVDTTNRHDGAILEISADGGETWEYVTPNEGYDAPLFAASGGPSIACLGITSQHGVWTGPTADSDDWRHLSVDLTPYLGEDILVRFGFGSNAVDDDRRGVYFDRVVVVAGARADTTPPEPGGLLGVVAPGWEVTGTDPSWLYGIPTTGPLSLRPVWATGLHGAYNSGECSAVVSRPIDTTLIPGLGRLELTFQHYFNTPLTTHAGIIQVTDDDGETWRNVTPVGGYPNALGVAARDCLTPGQTGTRGYASSVNTSYEGATVDLRQFDGDTIRIRFAFHSTVTTNRGDGWYLRDIGFTRGAGSVPAGSSGPGAGLLAALPPQVGDALLAAADDEMLRLLEEGGTGLHDVILTGPPHRGLDEVSFERRADWMAWFDAQAAGFFADVEAGAEALGAQIVGRWSVVPAMKVRAPLHAVAFLPHLTGAEHMAEDRDDRVSIIEPIESDEVGATNTQGRKMIEAEEIWALGYMGEGVRISVVDTGIDPAHEAFKNADGSSRIAAFANCQGVSGCVTVGAFDDNAHGTHVAATAAGSDLYEDPQHGTFEEVGVAPRAELIGAKFLNAFGSGSLADAMDALEWSFENDADLTSNSWGGGCTAGANALLTMVNNQAAAGMLTVAAVGNNPPSPTPLSPACALNAVAAGAVDNNEVIASFSTRGPCRDPSQGNAERICPDLVAKGVAVRSAVPRSGATNGHTSGYQTFNGTSMSTPHVAGAVALIEQMKRAFTGTGWDTAAGAEREVLQMTAKPLGSPSPNNTYGAGLPQLLNVYALLDATDEANIISTFSVNPQVVRLGDSTMLSFGVRNLGGAIATGEFLATLTNPDGSVTTLADSTVSLGLLDGESVTHVVTVDGDVAPGEYLFAGSFAYSWTDGDGNLVEDLVMHADTFQVSRVFMDIQVDGFEPEATLLETQRVTVSLENTGNEDGQSVVLEFTVPDAYRFMPSSPLDLLNPSGHYSDPPPNQVVRDDHFGRTTLVYRPGTLPVGERFEVSLNLLPVETGNHWVRAVGKFQDGAGNAGLQSRTVAQTVSLI